MSPSEGQPQRPAGRETARPAVGECGVEWGGGADVGGGGAMIERPMPALFRAAKPQWEYAGFDELPMAG